MRLQLVPLIESGDRLQLVANREHQAKTDVFNCIEVTCSGSTILRSSCRATASSTTTWRVRSVPKPHAIAQPGHCSTPELD